MNTSELIELWYTKFCIKKLKPMPDFKTFKILMERHDYNFDGMFAEYKEKFDK